MTKKKVAPPAEVVLAYKGFDKNLQCRQFQFAVGETNTMRGTSRGFGGCGFRKIYNDPIKRMPLSRSVDAKDLIVNHAEVDFDDCRRVTHRIRMRRSQVKQRLPPGRLGRRKIVWRPHRQPTRLTRGFKPTGIPTVGRLPDGTFDAVAALLRAAGFSVA